jgi:uncharacterized protein
MSTDPSTVTPPNYVELVRFLLQPFVDAPASLKIDAEFSHANTRTLVRVALDEAEDAGRVFGRGGRNLKAVTAVLEGLAQATGGVVRLEVFGAAIDAKPKQLGERRPAAPSGPRPKPTLKPKN